MKVRGYLLIYALLVCLEAVLSAGLCYFAKSMDFLPEALAISGGVMGFSTMLFAFLVAGKVFALKSDLNELGDVVRRSSCVAHVGRRRGHPCMLSVCQRGVVVDGRGTGCLAVPWYSFDDYEELPSEVRFYLGRTKYRFVFDKALKAKLMQMSIVQAREYEAKGGML